MDFKIVTEEAVRLIHNTPQAQREQVKLPVDTVEFAPDVHELLRIVASRNNVTMTELLNTILDLVLPTPLIYPTGLNVFVFSNVEINENWEFLTDADSLEVGDERNINYQYIMVAKVRHMAQMLRDFLELKCRERGLSPKVTWFPDSATGEFVPIVFTQCKGATYVLVEDHEDVVATALHAREHTQTYWVSETGEDWPDSLRIEDHQFEEQEQEYAAPKKESIDPLN